MPATHVRGSVIQQQPSRRQEGLRDTRAERLGERPSAGPRLLGDLRLWAAENPGDRSVVADVLTLQRSAGNRAVTGLLADRAGLLAIQRQPDTVSNGGEFGLATTESVHDISAEAVAYWRANPDKTARELVEDLVSRIITMLDTSGVYRPSHVLGITRSDNEVAHFAPKDWTLTIDVSKAAETQVPFVPVSVDTRLKDVSARAVGKLAAACSHELRHCEQSFLAARLSAEETKDRRGGALPGKGRGRASVIASDLDIPEAVADAALHSKVRLNASEKAKAAEFRAFSSNKSYLSKFYWKMQKLWAELKLLLPVIRQRAAELGESKTFASILKAWKSFFRPLLKPVDDIYMKVADIGIEVSEGARSGPTQGHGLTVKALESVAKVSAALLEIKKADNEIDSAEKYAADAQEDRKKGRRAAADAEDKVALLGGQQALMQTVLGYLESDKEFEEIYRNSPHEADAYREGERIEEKVGLIAAGFSK